MYSTRDVEHYIKDEKSIPVVIFFRLASTLWGRHDSKMMAIVLLLTRGSIFMFTSDWGRLLFIPFSHRRTVIIGWLNRNVLFDSNLSCHSLEPSFVWIAIGWLKGKYIEERQRNRCHQKDKRVYAFVKRCEFRCPNKFMAGYYFRREAAYRL